MRELGKQLGLLLALLVVLAILYALFGSWPTQPGTNTPAAQKALIETPPSPQVLQQLQQEPASFQYLISYTGRGFEPSSVTIKKGDTVRFTNNSTGNLWVASVGEGAMQIYPGTSSCDGSTFDSCTTLQPGDFWEFTFNETGTWEYQNNLDKQYTGTVTVK